MKRLLAATLALILAFTLAIPAFADDRAPTYSDITADTWYSDAVKYVTLGNLMDPAGYALFKPDSTATRADIVKTLYRLVGSPFLDTLDVTYDDVVGDVIAPAAWAAQNGIMNGVGGGKFNPNGTLDRETMATILYRVSKYAGKDTSARADLSKYDDANTISAWAAEEFSWAVAEGVFNGTSTTTLSPKQATPRAQIAVLVQRTGERVLGVTFPDDGNNFVFATAAASPAPAPKPAAAPAAPTTTPKYTHEQFMNHEWTEEIREYAKELKYWGFSAYEDDYVEGGYECWNVGMSLLPNLNPDVPSGAINLWERHEDGGYFAVILTADGRVKEIARVTTVEEIRSIMYEYATWMH